MVCSNLIFSWLTGLGNGVPVMLYKIGSTMDILLCKCYKLRVPEPHPNAYM